MIQVKNKLKPKSKPKQKIKTFDEYFQDCIKNKSIPKDTPYYLKKALERAMKEYDNGIKLQKSALSNFAEKYVIDRKYVIEEKYVIDGKPGLTPIQFFEEKVAQIKEFLRNHRNIKVRMIFICKMEQRINEKPKRKTKIFFNRVKSYFHSKTHENLEST